MAAQDKQEKQHVKAATTAYYARLDFPQTAGHHNKHCTTACVSPIFTSILFRIFAGTNDSVQNLLQLWGFLFCSRPSRRHDLKSVSIRCCCLQHVPTAASVVSDQPILEHSCSQALMAVLQTYKQLLKPRCCCLSIGPSGTVRVVYRL